MKLTEIAKAVKETNQPRNCFNIIVYGEPKTGKTEFAATIAKVPWIENVYWFDVENGADTLVRMTLEGKLTQEEAAKITIYSIPDTKEEPRAMETMMKALTLKRDLVICEEHGKINCENCRLAAGSKVHLGQPFNIAKCTPNDVVVIDTMSALGVSILNYYLRNKKADEKAGWDEYGPQGLMLTDAHLVIQNASTNFISLAHIIGVEYKENDVEREKIFPQVGTKNVSRTIAKYYSHVIFLEMKMGLHKGGSGTDYRKDVITGSRGGWRLEDRKELNLAELFSTMDIKPKGIKK